MASRNLQLNTNNCFNHASSRRNYLQMNTKKTYLSFSNKRQNKVKRFVCSARYPLDEIKDMQRQLGIVKDQTKVVEEIKEEAEVKKSGGKLYNLLYPDKELLPEDKEMSLFDHLEELRERLLISVLAVTAAIGGCFVYSKELIMLLEAPVRSQGVRFLQLAPGEFFFTTIKVSGYCGILLGSPMIHHSVCPSRINKIRKKILSTDRPWIFDTFLFGDCVVLTPAALNFFVTYAEGVVESLWSYFEFVLVLMFSTGLSFQVKLVWCLVTKCCRYVVVGAVIAAAIVTPSVDSVAFGWTSYGSLFWWCMER